LLEKAGADLERPIASLLERLPIQHWVKGKVAVGIRALGLTITRVDGTKVTYEISREKPISARLLHEFIGLGVGAALKLPDGGAIKIEPDMLLVVDPGPALRDAFDRGLENLPEMVKATHVEIAGKTVLKLSITHAERGAPVVSIDMFADVSGERWIAGTRASSFETALKGGPESSLAASAKFKKVRERLTNGDSILMTYVNLADVFAMARNFVAPILVEELELLGISSVEGFGLGMSFAEGGVRETVAITTDGRRRGLLSLLDAWPGGLGTLELAPENTTGFIAFKFDAMKLYERALGIAKTFAPGTAKHLDGMARSFDPGIGLSIVEDILPALGAEVSFFLFPPKSGPIPEAIVAIRIRDGEKFDKLLDVARKRAADAGFEARTLRMSDGDDGFMFEIEGAPAVPAFAVRDGWLFGAMNPQLLRKFCRGLKSEERTSLGKDGETFKKVINAVARGRTDRVVALGYVDLKRVIPMGLGLLSMAPSAVDEFLDTALVPEVESIQPYFSGLAWAVQIDEDAISFDLFSPTGIFPGLIAGGIYAAQQQQAQWEEIAREMEANRAAEMERMRALEGPFVGFNAGATEKGDALVIATVIDGTPAAAAGLAAGDVIVKLGEHVVVDFPSFRAAIEHYKAGDAVKMVVKRGDEEIELSMKLGRRGDYVSDR
jgi:hypothetical protein